MPRLLHPDYVIPSKRKPNKRPIPLWKIYPELRGFIDEMILDGVECQTLMKHLSHLGMTKNVAYGWKRRITQRQVLYRAMLDEMGRDPEMMKKRGQFLTGLLAARKEWREQNG